MRRVVVTENESKAPLGAEQIQAVENAVKREISFRNRAIPDKKLFDVELNGLAEKIRDIKLENKQYELVKKVQGVLCLFDPEDNRYNDKLLLFTMQAVENFIVKPKSGNRKLAVVIECVRDYFKGDEELIIKMVEILLPKIKKMNIFRRNWKRIARFFCATPLIEL